MGNASQPKSFEDAKAQIEEDKKHNQEKDEMEDWAVLKRCRGHRGSKWSFSVLICVIFSYI